MATTTRPISELTLGVRDITGAVVASGKARFYLPGTLTATTIYSDDVCTAAITQPLTLNAGGQYKSAYALEATRMIVKDSTETTTYYDGLVNVNRHDAVYVTSPSWNSGAETTLEALLALMSTNLGADGKYLESAGATAIAYSTFLGQLLVSVTNFGAVGDGTTDDTAAVQAAMDRVEARGGGWVYFPKGTWRINSALTIDTAGVSIMGAGRGIAVIKNFGTTTNAITVNISGDTKLVMRDFSITANSTTSGTGIAFTSGNHAAIHNVGIGLHRVGISASAVLGVRLHDIVIDSTDDNASSGGISLGIMGRLDGGTLSAGTNNGTGVSAAGADARILNTNIVTGFATGLSVAGDAALASSCHVNNATTGVLVSGADACARNIDVFGNTTGVSLTGARATAIGCTAASTTGYSLGVASAAVIGCTAFGGTTGFSVGAFANCRIIGCVSTSATSDLTVNASATLLVEHSNHFTTVTDTSGAGHSWMANRPKVVKVTKVTTAGTTPAFTPTPQTCDIYVCDASAATVSITINATPTTGLVDGQLFTLVVQRTGGSGSLAPAMAGQYGIIATIASTAGGATDAWTFPMVWRSASALWMPLQLFTAAVDPINAGNLW